MPLGQAEAARAIGLTFSQTLRMIVLPQAFRAVIAPLGSVLIALTKNTTIAAAIGVAEAAGVMQDADRDDGDEVIAIFVGFALGFVVLTLPIGLLVRLAGAAGWRCSDELDPLRRPRAAGPRAQPAPHRRLRRSCCCGLAWFVYVKFDEKGQWAAEKWKPLPRATSGATSSCPGLGAP